MKTLPKISNITAAARVRAALGAVVNGAFKAGNHERAEALGKMLKLLQGDKDHAELGAQIYAAVMGESLELKRLLADESHPLDRFKAYVAPEDKHLGTAYALRLMADRAQEDSPDDGNPQHEETRQ